MRQVVAHSASGDDASRFLRELRQLRAGAGLGHAELAARAHYPYDRIKAAEVGPSLPDLPVLSAFVRGCGGTTDEWEERWRSLTRTPSLPVPASRQAGRSDASAAGARISAVNQAAGAPDASIIRAALDRVAEGMAGGVDAPSVTPAVMEPESISSPVSPGGSDGLGGLVGLDVPDVPDVPAGEAWPQDKPSGWDPIRVSSAWPALGRQDIPEVPTTTAGPATGKAAPAPAPAPWESAPWSANPASDSVSSSAASGGAGAWAPAARGVPAANGHASPAPGSAPAAPGHAATTSRSGKPASGLSSRTRLVVLAAVLLCVLAVVLAVFA